MVENGFLLDLKNLSLELHEKNNARLGEMICESSRPGGCFIPQECESYRLSVSTHADKSALMEFVEQAS